MEMAISRVNNPLITVALNTFKRAHASQVDLYSSISQATTIIASDVAKAIDYYDVHMNSIFGNCDTKELNKNLRIVARIRSGLPMVEALRQFFKCGKSSCIILDKMIDSEILYSSVGFINKFEKCIYCEPFLIDDAPVRIVINHLLSQGASQKNIVLIALATSKEIVEQLSSDYPDICIICGQADNYFSIFNADDKNYDCVGGVIFGDKEIIQCHESKEF